MSPSSHLRPRLSRLASAVRAGAAAAALALIVSGCSSSHPSQEPAPTSELAPAPSGPCDEHHREQAIVAASAAAGKVSGGAQLSEPSAHFLGMALHPQMPGQPAQQPIYGWNVTFTTTSTPTPDPEPSAPARAPAAALDTTQTAVRSPPPSTLAPPSVPAASAPPADAAAVPPSPPAPQAAPGRAPANGSAPSDPRAQTAAPAASTRRSKPIVIFVAVDGSTRVL